MALACYFQAPLKRVQATDAADHCKFDDVGARVIGRNKYVEGMSWWYKLLHRHLGIFSFCNDEWKAEVEIWHRRRASSRSLLPSLTFVFHSQLRNHSEYCLQDDAINHVAIQASTDSLSCQHYAYVVFY